MSVFLFLLVIDWVTKKMLREGITGIRWRFTKKLENLDFADDLALLSSTRRKLQLENERFSNASKVTGLNINVTKTKVMRLKPGFHISGKSQTVWDFTVSRPSQILQTNENLKS